jgi:hypothetical protein
MVFLLCLGRGLTRHREQEVRNMTVGPGHATNTEPTRHMDPTESRAGSRPVAERVRRDIAAPRLADGGLTPRSAWRFFAATFILSWGLGALVITFMDQIEDWFGPMGYTNPAFILMVYSPGFIGVYMVWRHYGPAWPGAQPWDMVGFVVVAVLVAWVNRRTMLRRGSGSTAVLLGEVGGR